MTAWRRLRGDRVAMVSLAVVLAYLLLMAAAAGGLVARDWAREVAVSHAPPSWSAGNHAVSAPRAPGLPEAREAQAHLAFALRAALDLHEPPPSQAGA